MRKIALLWLTLLLTLMGSVTAAQEMTVFEALKAQNEMRQNITWTTEGIYHLGRSKDRKLALTAAQARKMLPIYQELIAKKLVRLENGPARPDRQGRSGLQDLPPEAAKRRIRAITALTQFGNTKMAELNKILTAAQVKFIDDLNFNPEKYGYRDYAKFAPQSANGQRPDQSQMRKLRRKNQVNREKLFKLNRDVLEILKKLK